MTLISPEAPKQIRGSEARLDTLINPFGYNGLLSVAITEAVSGDEEVEGEVGQTERIPGDYDDLDRPNRRRLIPVGLGDRPHVRTDGIKKVGRYRRGFGMEDYL